MAGLNGSKAVGFAFPALGDREVAGVEDRESPRRVAVGVAEHRDRDDVARHAVHRVRRRQPELVTDLITLDHVLDRRRPWVGDVEEVDPARAETGDDQRVALELGMACRRARVPAEVVQFVADIRHVGAADDLAVAR